MSLSASAFKSGSLCAKRLWLENYKPELLASASSHQKRRAGQKLALRRLAQSLFPEGYLASGTTSDGTKGELLALFNTQGKVLFEPLIQAQSCSIRPDILQKDGDKFILYGVRATTSVTPHDIKQLAFQYLVTRSCGLTPVSVVAIHLCPAPKSNELKEIFEIKDITKEVDKLLDDTERQTNNLLKTIEAKSEPVVMVGSHCKTPPCPFKQHCWSSIPRFSIFSIPRLGDKKAAMLLSKGIISLADITSDEELTDLQKRYVRTVQSGQAYIDRAQVEVFLESLKYPLHFFDIETVDDPLPSYPGARPYEPLPFQFSCHQLDKNNGIQHFEFISQHQFDPRNGFLRALSEAIQPTGSIIVYNKSFEERVLKNLQQSFPEFDPFLVNAITRLVDLEPVFRNHVIHPNFFGKSSLKAVLPALVPHLSYDSLAIQNGEEAMVAWEALVASDNELFKQKLLVQLREYCALDTMAMLELVKVLETIASGNSID